jgi:hypothetical protein
LYIIQPNVSILLAGYVSDMKEFLKELRMRCSYRSVEELRIEHIEEFLHEYSQNTNFKMPSFLISLIERVDAELGRSTHIKNGNWGELEVNIFEKAYACGTGTDGYFRILKEPVHSSSSHEKDDPHRTLQMNIAYISKLLARQKRDVTNIDEGWGAGYEVVFYDGSRFQKMDDIAYVVCHGQFDCSGNIGIPKPILVLHYKYRNDVLFITAIDFANPTFSDDGNHYTFRCKNASVNIHIVSSIETDEVIREEDLPKDYSFATVNVANGYLIEHASPGYIPFDPALYTPTGAMMVVFSQDNDSISFKISKDANELISSSAKRIFPTLSYQQLAN